MIRSEKVAVVKEITEIFKEAKGIFVTDFKGLDVEKMGELRRRCREVSVKYIVVKNTLARIAAKNSDWNQLVEHLQGPSAIAYSYDDPSAPARVITKFAKEHEKPTIKVSIFEGSFYGPESVQEIASLPSKEILLARLVGGLSGPIQGLTGRLHGLLQKLVMTVDAVRQSKDQ